MTRRSVALLVASVALLAPSPALAAWGKSKETASRTLQETTTVTTTEAKASVVKSEQTYDEWSSFNQYWCAQRTAQGRHTWFLETVSQRQPLTRCPRRYNEVTGDVSLEDPLVDFRGHTTPDGHTFWLDKASGESTWRVPLAALCCPDARLIAFHISLSPFARLKARF